MKKWVQRELSPKSALKTNKPATIFLHFAKNTDGFSGEIDQNDKLIGLYRIQTRANPLTGNRTRMAAPCRSAYEFNQLDTAGRIPGVDLGITRLKLWVRPIRRRRMCILQIAVSILQK
jgi:hypothetical protein